MGRLLLDTRPGKPTDRPLGIAVVTGIEMKRPSLNDGVPTRSRS